MIRAKCCQVLLGVARCYQVFLGADKLPSQVFKSEGILGFYRGFPVFAMGVLFGQAYITTYEYTKHKCSDMNLIMQVYIHCVQLRPTQYIMSIALT